MSTQKNMKLFEKIYNETYTNLLKFVVYKCDDINEIDDIIQDTYLEFFKELEKGKNIIDKMAYLYAIAKNKIIVNYQNKTKVKTISIFQEKDDEQFTIDIDARRKYRIRFYNKR